MFNQKEKKPSSRKIIREGKNVKIHKTIFMLDNKQKIESKIIMGTIVTIDDRFKSKQGRIMQETKFQEMESLNILLRKQKEII